MYVHIYKKGAICAVALEGALLSVYAHEEVTCCCSTWFRNKMMADGAHGLFTVLRRTSCKRVKNSLVGYL